MFLANTSYRALLILLIGSNALLASPTKHGLPGLNFYFPNTTSPEPFDISVSQDYLDQTRCKVRDYRPTTDFTSEWTSEGPPEKNMTIVAQHWATKYDWRAIENRMNEEFDHFATTVPGNGNYSEPIPLHFIHQRSDADDAIPLLLVHGWPSTFLEWQKVTKPLAQRGDQSYHVVAVDLPGFGFSPAPTHPGLGPREMGKAFDALMHQLGYKKYGLVSTDLGWYIGMWMVHDVHDSILGHMTDFFQVQANDTDRKRVQEGKATADEAAYIASQDKWFSDHWLYATAHIQKPLALAQSLTDSPMGFLGWMWDPTYATSDGYQYSNDELITSAMMLSIPGPYSNIRLYLEIFKAQKDLPETDIPTGVSEWGWSRGPFPDLANFAFAPPSWIKRLANLVYFKKHEFGGHFPALSYPELWVQDVRAFFSSLDLQK